MIFLYVKNEEFVKGCKIWLVGSVFEKLIKDNVPFAIQNIIILLFAH